MGLFDFGEPQPRQRVPSKRQQLSRPVFTRPQGWAPPDNLPELSGFVGLDSENKDPGISSGTGTSWPYAGVGFTTGWALSAPQGDIYLPLAHSDGNMDPDKAIRWLAAQAKKPDVTFVYANAPYDMGWLHRVGIHPVNMPIDVQSVAALINEHRFRLDLDSLGREYLGEGKNTKEFLQECAKGGLHDPMANMDLVPAWLAERYSLQDARLAVGTFDEMWPEIERQNLKDIFELERECALVALDMKIRGVKVNLDTASRHMHDFERKREAHIQEVKRLTGVNIDPNDVGAIARALRAENSAVDIPKTSQGRDSIKGDWLESLRSPVADAVNACRKYDKAISTFLMGYIFGHEYKGRIHCDFHPLRRDNEDTGGKNGTISGRFASSDPNLQNVPTRDPEIGNAIRECFEPEEEERWAKLDYASQEPRLTVHFAVLAELAGFTRGKTSCRGAQEMMRRFIENPMLDLHAETATLMFGSTFVNGTKEERTFLRKRSKAINLGLAYGMGGAKLCRQLGLPTMWKEINGRRMEVAGPEGQRLLDLHFKGVPFIRGLQKLCQERAEAKGIIRTIAGRVCHFEKDGDEYLWTYAACNRLIQGSAADQMKIALCHLRREGIPVLLTVHDESDLSVPMGEAGDRLIARVQAIMEAAVPLRVPVVAEVKLGAHWAETGENWPQNRG